MNMYEATPLGCGQPLVQGARVAPNRHTCAPTETVLGVYMGCILDAL